MGDQGIVFSQEDCQTILERCFETKNVRYLGHIVRSLLGDVEGYLAEHYSLDITYNLGQSSSSIANKQFFVKALGKQTGFLAEFANCMDVFRKEAFVYNYIFKEFEKFTLHFKPFAPKCYFTKENCLVLGDLKVEGFKIEENPKMYNLSQCQITLQKVAQYHANSIIYEEIKSKETGKIFRWHEHFPEEFEERYYIGDDSSLMFKLLKACTNSLLVLIDELPEEICSDKEEFKRMLKKEDDEDLSNRKFEKRFRHTCTHGDLWSKNIMFKYENDTLVDCKLIDFQILTYSLPAFDVELFLYAVTNLEFRKIHKKDLYQFYYDCLRKELSKNGLNISEIFSFQDLLKSATLVAPRAKIQAMCDMVLLYYPQEHNQETEENLNFLRNLLIDERCKCSVEVFRNNSEFKGLFTKELLDLRIILDQKRKLLNTMVQENI